MKKFSLESKIAVVLVILSVGSVFATLSWPDGAVRSIDQQSDGKTIVGGKFSAHHIQRLLVDGRVDESFSKTWTAGGFNREVASVAVQSDDKILVGGDFTNFDQSLVGYIARLNADGSLDTSFVSSTGTGFDDMVDSVSVDDKGKILVGGHFKSFNGTSVGPLVRLLPNGTLDGTFSPKMELKGPVFALKQNSIHGLLLVGGEFKGNGENFKVISDYGK